MLTMQRAARLAAVLSLAALLHSPLVAAAPDTLRPAPSMSAAPSVLPEEQPISTTLRDDRTVLGTSRLAMPSGATWETAVDAGWFTVHVKTGELVVALGEGEGAAHLASAARPVETQLLGAGDEVVLRPDDWLTIESYSTVIVRNRATRPASALLFRVIPLAPIFATDLLTATATADDAFWIAPPREATDDAFRRAMPHDETQDEFWRTVPDQQAPSQLRTL